MGHAGSDDGVGEGGLPAPCEERVKVQGQVQDIRGGDRPR